MFKSRIKWDEQALEELKNDLLGGMTFTQCGEKRGLSRQSMQNITKRYNLFLDGEIFGKSVSARAKEKEAIDKHFKRWGMSFEERMASDKDAFYDICRKKFLRKKNNCIRAGVPFDIDFVDLSFPEFCPVLGLRLQYDDSKGCFNEARDNCASFDKIDPSKGYTRGNVHVISMRANRIKNDSTLEELEKIFLYFKKLGMKIASSNFSSDMI